MTRDLREAIRLMRADPGFAAVIVLTLALGIGVTSTIFSVLNGVLLRPLQYGRPGELVVLWESNRQLGQPQEEVSGATYLDWRARSKSFSNIGAYRYRGFTLTGAGSATGAAERVASVDVSPALFTVLGISAQLGRTFSPEEERPGHERLAVLSHGAWQRRFGSDRGAVGRTMLLDGLPYEIVGVMPASFQFPPGDPAVEVWSPLTFDLTALASRPHRMYATMGRLASGVTIDRARAEMDGIAREIARDQPASNAGWGVSLVPAHEQVVGNIGPTLWVLFGAVVLVLLIACANITNLLLARSARAGRDFAVRAAFGASRLALVRRSLVESGVLAVSGGAFGLTLAWLGIRALRPLVPPSIPRADNIGLDLSVVGFSVLMTLGAGLLFGAVPAWRAMKPNLLDVLQEGGRSNTGSRRSRWLSDAMVISEVAVALVLVIGAGLLLRSFVRLTSVDPGFRTTNVLAMHIVLPDVRYRGAAPKKQFFDDFLERLRAVPSFERVSAVSALPMSPLGVLFELNFTIDGLEATSPSERPRAHYRGVMPGYFEAMAIPLRQGRTFDRFDGREDSRRVAIVNETLAKRYFGDDSPIDRQLKMPMAGDLTIVGVVADIRHDGLQAAAAPEVFVPYHAAGALADAPCRRDGPADGGRHGRGAGGSGRPRSLAAVRPDFTARRSGVSVDRAAAIQHAVDHRARAVRRGAGRGRRVRPRDVLGDAPHGGDRPARGARGAAAADVRAGRPWCAQIGSRRRGGWSRLRGGSGKIARAPALWRLGIRFGDLHRGRAHAHRRRPAGGDDAGPEGIENRSGSRAQAGVAAAFRWHRPIVRATQRPRLRSNTAKW